MGIARSVLLTAVALVGTAGFGAVADPVSDHGEPRFVGCEGAVIRGNEVLSRPNCRGAMLPIHRIVEEDFKSLRDWGANLARYQMTENFFRHGEMKGGLPAYDKTSQPCRETCTVLI